TGDFQYPFSAITLIISWQFIASLVSASSLAAASKALSFFGLLLPLVDFCSLLRSALAAFLVSSVLADSCTFVLVAMMHVPFVEFVCMLPRAHRDATATVSYLAGQDTSSPFARNSWDFVRNESWTN